MQRDHLNEIDPTQPLHAQAASWWTLLNHGDATAADHCAFGEWVARSPERVAAFLQVARLSQALKSDAIRWPATPVETLIREAKAAATDVVDRSLLPREARDVPAARTISRSALFSPRLIPVSVAVCAGLALTLYLVLRPLQYRTELGEQHAVVLSDGSVVTLNTSSLIEVRMRREQRSVKLLSGEALFQVAHDSARPFDVAVGDTTVRAVGTQFDIHRGDASTTVTVVEGKVAVFTPSAQPGGAQPLPLAAGEQLTVSPQTEPHSVRADVRSATAWTQRKLIFDQRPLVEVAAEFNRYNRQTIEIRSPGLRGQEVTGVFQADDPESFVSFLATIPNVVIERLDGNRRWVVTQSGRATPGP